jgi:hypothetical protein
VHYHFRFVASCDTNLYILQVRACRHPDLCEVRGSGQLHRQGCGRTVLQTRHSGHGLRDDLGANVAWLACRCTILSASFLTMVSIHTGVINGRKGMVPRRYLRPMTSSTPTITALPLDRSPAAVHPFGDEPEPPKVQRCIAIKPYSSPYPSHLSFEAGAVIMVSKMPAAELWFGVHRGNAGVHAVTPSRRAQSHLHLNAGDFPASHVMVDDGKYSRAQIDQVIKLEAALAVCNGSI